MSVRANHAQFIVGAGHARTKGVFMSTAAQIAANQQNAQHSCGPKTEEGKANSSQNNFRHGFTSDFFVLDWEDGEAFANLVTDLRKEHQPANPTESLLVDKMAQHYWLTQRALTLQELALRREELPFSEQEKQLALYLRYQTTNDRAFHKCLDQLLKLRAEKRKAEIGFESQQLKRAQEARKEVEQTHREAAEKRKQELHQVNVWLTEAKANRQETETTIAKVRESQRVESANRMEKLIVEEVSRQIHLQQAA